MLARFLVVLTDAHFPALSRANSCARIYAPRSFNQAAFNFVFVGFGFTAFACAFPAGVCLASGCIQPHYYMLGVFALSQKATLPVQCRPQAGAGWGWPIVGHNVYGTFSKNTNFKGRESMFE